MVQVSYSMAFNFFYRAKYFVIYLFNKSKIIYVTLRRPIAFLLLSDYSEKRRIKTICGFFYGFCLGLLLWYTILAHLGFSRLGCFIIGMTLCFVLGEYDDFI